MDDDELRRSAALEQRHWWYSGRRALVRRLMRAGPPAVAIDVGPGPGGNAAVLRDLGWQVTGVELTEVGARLCAERGLDVVRGDATRLPLADRSVDLVMSTDVWEHIEDHEAVGVGVVPRPPAGWSPARRRAGGHGHVERARRRPGSRPPLRAAGAARPRGAARLRGPRHRVVERAAPPRRQAATQPGRPGPTTARSEMEHVAAPVNAGLRLALALESLLPVGRRKGLSLVVQAHRPSSG